MFKGGILIYSGIDDFLKEQLKINSGVEPIQFSGEVEYRENSYIPKKDWRNLNEKELQNLLTTNKNLPFFRAISIGNTPTRIKELVKRIELHKSNSLFEIDSLLKQNEKVVTELSDELELFLKTKSSSKRFKFHRITKGQPNRETTTFHSIDKKFIKFIGLHIDESKVFTPYTAHKSDNRISINISEESRYLFFVNLTLRQIADMVKDNRLNSSNIVESFFGEFPNYPIIRLEIKPFQYYIAPTDNLIHDGSTLNNKGFDITIVYTGVFDQY